MNISNLYKGKSGVEYWVEYSDSDDFSILPLEECRQTYGVCFYEDKMVIGYSGGRKEWGLIGGTVEPGESLEQTLKREIREESNMEVLASIPVGYQKVTDTRDGTHVYQLRYACTARPHGPFIADPMGDILKIELIDSKDHKQYFDWG